MSRREFSLEIFFFPFGYLAVPETPWSGNARVCVLCSFYEKSNVHELNAIISLKKKSLHSTYISLPLCLY